MKLKIVFSYLFKITLSSFSSFSNENCLWADLRTRGRLSWCCCCCWSSLRLASRIWAWELLTTAELVVAALTSAALESSFELDRVGDDGVWVDVSVEVDEDEDDDEDDEEDEEEDVDEEGDEGELIAVVVSSEEAVVADVEEISVRRCGRGGANITDLRFVVALLATVPDPCCCCCETVDDTDLLAADCCGWELLFTLSTVYFDWEGWWWL